MLNNKCFLMSKELFQTLPNHMKSFFDVNGNPHWWWLRSFGYFQYHAAYVYNDGKVIHSGAPVDCGDGAVRPVLLINPDSGILSNNGLDLIEFGCYNGKPVQWYVVDRRKGYLLLKNFLVDHCFRKDNHAKDADDYDASDIKKYLFEEFLPTIFTEDQIADISENRPISKFVTPAPMIRLPDHPTKEQIRQVLKWVSKFNISPRAILEEAAPNVIASKIWVEDDVRNELYRILNEEDIECSDKDFEYLLNDSIDSIWQGYAINTLEDCTEEEWEVISSACSHTVLDWQKRKEEEE